MSLTQVLGKRGHFAKVSLQARAVVQVSVLPRNDKNEMEINYEFGTFSPQAIYTRIHSD